MGVLPLEVLEYVKFIVLTYLCQILCLNCPLIEKFLEKDLQQLEAIKF